MNTLTLTADKWINEGIAVIPIAYRDKRPSIASWSEFQTRLPTAAEIRRWFQDRFNNIAVITGWRGLTVLDFDERAAYSQWREWSRAHAPQARFSYTVESRRGVHVYLFIDEPTHTSKADNLDIKAAGGYVLAPPSIHPSGRPYRLLSDAPILRVPSLAAVLPAAQLAVIPPPPPRIERTETLIANPWQSAMAPALLTDATISDALARRDILDLFPGAVRRGGRWWACCPLHDDRNPSVSIDADGRRARCWGGCLWGDYADWYAAIHNVPLSVALRELT